jgi:cytochrome c oxidase subunit 3
MTVALPSPSIVDAPPPEPARPRVLLIGTAFAGAAAAMAFAGMLATYLGLRAHALEFGADWLPPGVSIPLMPGTMGFVTLALSSMMVQWAVYAVGNDDRPAAYFALGLTLVLGFAYVVDVAYYYTQVGATVRDPSGFGVLFYGITGAHLAMTGAGMVFILLMAFRTLGGSYSGRDREGVAAAALFWHTTVAVYTAIWIAIFVLK